MVITNTDNVSDSGTLELLNLRTIATGNVGGNTLVFAGGNDDGISVFQLADDGTLTSLFDLDDDSALELDNLRELQFVEVGGNPILIAAGNDDGLSTFSVASDGTLTLLDEIEDDASLLLNNVDALTTISVGGNTFVITGNAHTAAQEGVSVFSLGSDGSLTHVDQVTEDSDPSNLELNNLRAVVGAESGGTSYIIAGGDDDGLSVFSIDSSGNLTNVFNIADGTSPDLGGEDLELNNLTALAAVSTGGNTYVYAGGEDDGVSVFTLNGDGSLTHIFDYEDGGALQLTNLRSLEIATSQSGQNYLFVVGDDDALQAYSIAADGSLTLVQTYDDDGNTEINNAEDVAFVLVDGRMMAIAGGDEDGISAFNVPCFTPGTRILTPQGDRLVEDLKPGDLVITQDHGAQPIRAVARRSLSAAQLEASPQFRAIRIRRGALGGGLPLRDLVVSPQHRMLVGGRDTNLLFGLDAALASARCLVNGGAIGLAPEAPSGLDYIHLVFDRHQIIFAESAPTESFFPGTEAIDGLGGATRAELFALFPELATGDAARFRPARPFLKHFEAAIVARRLPELAAL
ncbi:MAG: Hint domain-containing protein [Rhodobacteraceae bacterium]|nr:Hint domain-containing protein [Paracoccaceae bacterium]